MEQTMCDMPEDLDHIRKLILDTANLIKIKSEAHMITSRYYKNIDKLMAYPSIVFDAIVLFSLLFYITQLDPVCWIIYCAIGMSSVSLIMSSLRRYFNFAYAYHSHKLSHTLYSQIYRDTQMYTLNNNPNELYNNIIKRITLVEEHSEPLSHDLIVKLTNDV